MGVDADFGYYATSANYFTMRVAGDGAPLSLYVNG